VYANGVSGTLTSPPTDDSDLVARVIPLSRRGDRPPPPEFDLYADASLASRLDVPRHSERQAAIADTRTLERPAVERSRRLASLPASWRAFSLIVAVAAVVVVGLVVLVVGGAPRPHSRPLAHPPHAPATVSSTLADQHAAQRKAAATRAKKAAAFRVARAHAKARRRAAERAQLRTPVRSAPVSPPATTRASSSTTTNPCATAVPGQLGC